MPDLNPLTQLDNVGTEEHFADWEPFIPEAAPGYSSTRTIHVWPDGNWCDTNELSQLGCMGDDYRTVHVHTAMDNATINELAIMAANGASDDALIGEVVYWMGG